MHDHIPLDEVINLIRNAIDKNYAIMKRNGIGSLGITISRTRAGIRFEFGEYVQKQSVNKNIYVVIKHC